jgi:preprotein translocase subunit SecG
MEKVISILFLILCIAIIAVILTQRRKSGGFSGSFGGGGTQMDAPGATWQRMTPLEKITCVLMALFMGLCLLLVKLKV